MKYKKIQSLFLIILPVLAVGLATTGNSVTVVDHATGNVAVGSYFALIPETGNMQILPPLAALLAVFTGILAIGHKVTGRKSLLDWIMWVSALSGCAASLPVVLESDVTMVPHVLLPLLMCVEAVLSYWMGKQKEEPGSGRKLGKR